MICCSLLHEKGYQNSIPTYSSRYSETSFMVSLTTKCNLGHITRGSHWSLEKNTVLHKSLHHSIIPIQHPPISHHPELFPQLIVTNPPLQRCDSPSICFFDLPIYTPLPTASHRCISPTKPFSPIGTMCLT